jgi:threonine/homoserine/homoserine lactone efflux protein
MMVLAFEGLKMEIPGYLISVGLILLALVAGVISPGPSFVMAARTAVARGRADGLAVSFGLGLGATLIAALCLAGLHALLTAVPWLYMLLKIVGGLYLAWMAWQIWRGAPQPLDVALQDVKAEHASLSASFRLGLFTQISNPKAAVVYGSVFAALLPQSFPLIAALLVMAGVMIMETVWYCLVVLVLSSSGPRGVYLRAKTWIDRIAASVMGLLSMRLVLSAAD